MSTATTAPIPIIYQGTPEARDLVNPYMCAEGKNPRTYVWVGKYHSQHENGSGWLGPQAMCQLITATVDHEDVVRRILYGTTRYEPQTRNKIGGLGACRDLPPSQDEVEAVIQAAIKSIERIREETE